MPSQLTEDILKSYQRESALSAQVAALESELAKYQEVAAKENTLLDAWIAKAGEHQRQVAELTAECRTANIALDVVNEQLKSDEQEIAALTTQVQECQLQSGQRQIKIDALTAERNAARNALFSTEHDFIKKNTDLTIQVNTLAADLDAARKALLDCASTPDNAPFALEGTRNQIKIARAALQARKEW